ncbi:MAG: putative selenate reductase subunit YgfK [Clostridia bacterium]|nr:putative selenate reductase subunit YgfK [Clostridia bacterium]
MSEVMTPTPFDKLMNHVLSEYKQGAVFGVRRSFKPAEGKTLSLFSEKLETPFGPAAGPHTQLSQNIIAAYYAGSRFFELKTVQIMDGADLAACIGRPCILANDEGYNCEWSTELTVPQAFSEYVKAWFALKLLSKEYSWGDPDGFIFNMSVGYDFAGITTPKIDAFIEGLKNAESTEIWNECKRWALDNLDRFQNVDRDYIESISSKVCDSITLSTLHGCPPQEIEKIASYLIDVKKLNTFVKCNPTILGYDYARKTLDDLGFDYIAFDDHHFNEDLQYKDAVPMFKRLLALAEKNEVSFGLKLSNTFPVDVKQNELPSNEMYMSGRSLYPLTIEMARRMSVEFDGKLRLSFSGGADAFNIADLYSAGIWPITLATTILKTGGYQRLTQIAEKLYSLPYVPFDGVKVGAVERLAHAARSSSRNQKPIKPLPKRKLDKQVPLVDCFLSPCTFGCPIHQDIPEYVELVGKGKHYEALKLITEKNPLPFITGTICPHHCTDKCTRTFYDEPIRIRNAKLTAAKNGYDALMETLSAPEKTAAEKVAVIGGGPAGIAMSFFLARKGVSVTLYEKRDSLGGIVRYVIPEFRISSEAIDRDVAMMEKLGVKVKLNTAAPAVAELKEQGYTHVVFAVGAWAEGRMRLEKGEGMNVIRFLEDSKNGSLSDLGTDVVVIGGGNTAMDAARVAKRHKGVKNVRLVYRRTVRYMPADEEELHLALGEGVEFLDLLSPVALENNELLCEKMVLGEPDASGRRSPVGTGQMITVPCTTLITAVGEKIEKSLFEGNGIALTERGAVKTDDKLMTNLENVYVIGDCNRGPATVVEAIADAQKVADAIVGEHSFVLPACSKVSADSCFDKQGILCDYECAEKEASRCLHCGMICEACVQVCPNRANVAIEIPNKMPQIVHIDHMCNECGNCAVFCPYDSAPYKDKWTLFSTMEEFDTSENPGFIHLGGRKFKVRLGEAVENIDLDNTSFYPDLKLVLETVLSDYSYLL